MSLHFILIASYLGLQCIIAQEAANPTVQPTNFLGEDTPYQVIPSSADIAPDSSSTDVSTQNVRGTWLYGYTGCKKVFGDGAKAKIDNAYYDAWLMSNVAGVASNIDWNNAAALEFLGAPGLNKGEQPQIQAVFANAATVIYSNKNPFQHYIKVRCDDPSHRCQNRPDRDPCKPNQPSPNDPPKPTPLAYASNQDKSDTDYPMINLCQGFIDSRSLKDAITYGKALKSPENLRLSQYNNRAQIFLHELLHLDLAADSPKPNPPVVDLTIDIKIGQTGRTLSKMAYGTLYTKILARWPGRPGLGSTGYWVQRNSDNLAYYALAKYVTSKNDNIYPHLPIVINEVDGPPYPPYKLDSLAEFINDGSIFFLNTTDDVETSNKDAIGNDYPGCSEDENGNAAALAGSTISIDGFAPTSAYPDDYKSQVSSWVAALNTATPSPQLPLPLPPPPPPAPPTYVSGQCSFHLTETQTCGPNSKNLFAIIHLKDGSGNDIGGTSVDPNTNPIGDGINAGSSLSFSSKLPNPLVVTGEHQNDYIQFTYGGLSWQSKMPNGGAYCNNGGWDPRSGPICRSRFGNQNAVNNMDCFFPC